MKVLLLSPLPPPIGGIARWTERYLDWCESNLDVNVVNTALVGNRVINPGKKPGIIEEIKRANKIIAETRKALKEDNIDIMHLNTSCSHFGIYRDWICTILAKKRNIPVILHCHCNINDQLGKHKLAVFTFSKMVISAKKILVLNKDSKNYVNKIGFNSNEILPNFLLDNQISTQHVIKKNVEKVLFIGEIRVAKGILVIYEVAKRNPLIEFRLAGKVNEEMYHYKKPSNVYFTGVLENTDVQRELDMADIFLFPSFTEGFSNALLEAMARGLPVIASDVGANYDMVENKGGVIVPVNDVNATDNALKKLLDASVRKKMSAWNINKVKKTYMYKDVMNRLIEIYKEIIKI